MDKFRHCLTELSARNTIMTGYYSLAFLARLNNVQEELLYYPRRRCWRWRWRRRPQMLKFSLKFLRPHYFLTLSPI